MRPLGPARHAAASAILATAFGCMALACTSSPDGVKSRAGTPPPLASPSAGTTQSPPAEDAAARTLATGIAGAGAAATGGPGGDVTGSIPGLKVEVVSTYAYRDWMPRIGGPRGEDGGSPLHVAIGVLLKSSAEAPIVLSRSARLGATGTPLEPVVLDDLAGATPWPLRLEPGEERRLQIGTRDGPYFPLGEALDLEIDLTAASGDTVRIAIDDLPIGRTD